MHAHVIGGKRRSACAAQRLAEFAERCRQGGLAVTPQRIAIIRALLASTEHPRAEAIYRTVRRAHPHISLATIHRTLETLCAIGEARKVTMLHDSARYDGNLRPHHHVVCVRCRRIRDVEVPELEEALNGPIALDDFQVLGSSLEIRAVCGRCAAGKRPASAASPYPLETYRADGQRSGGLTGTMHKIADMLKDAEAKDQQEAENFVQQLYSPQRSTPDFTDKKEDWILGTFAELYNRYACPDFGGPELVWARRNMPGTDHADFSVYGADKSYLRDIEVAALFPKPPVKNPQRYEDFWPYPVHPDPSNPAVHDVDIDQLRKSKPYADLKRLIEKHLRNNYPPYWLVIYDNEFWVQDRGQLEGLIRQILQQILQKNVARLPANLKEVWAFSLPSNGKEVLIQAWP